MSNPVLKKSSPPPSFPEKGVMRLLLRSTQNKTPSKAPWAFLMRCQGHAEERISPTKKGGGELAATACLLQVLLVVAPEQFIFVPNTRRTRID
jgi:hypothetical protein